MFKSYGVHRCISCNLMIPDVTGNCPYCNSNQIVNNYERITKHWSGCVCEQCAIDAGVHPSQWSTERTKESTKEGDGKINMKNIDGFKKEELEHKLISLCGEMRKYSPAVEFNIVDDKENSMLHIAILDKQTGTMITMLGGNTYKDDLVPPKKGESKMNEVVRYGEPKVLKTEEIQIELASILSESSDDKIKTFTELADEMDRIVNILSEYFEIVKTHEYGTDDDGVHELALVVIDKKGGEIVGKKIKCKADLVPPKKGTHIWVESNGAIWGELSAGEFDENGYLKTVYKINVESGGMTTQEMVVNNWCVVGDENHHSEGWNPEWLDKVR